MHCPVPLLGGAMSQTEGALHHRGVHRGQIPQQIFHRSVDQWEQFKYSRNHQSDTAAVWVRLLKMTQLAIVRQIAPWDWAEWVTLATGCCLVTGTNTPFYGSGPSFKHSRILQVETAATCRSQTGKRSWEVNRSVHCPASSAFPNSNYVKETVNCSSIVGCISWSYCTTTVQQTEQNITGDTQQKQLRPLLYKLVYKYLFSFIKTYYC